MSDLHVEENVYDSLAEATGGEERWAFGTGFHDTLAGIDTAVPDEVDATALARRCLGLADDALICSQRLGLWVSNAHELEDEVALANIALDLLGQARMLLSRAARADPSLRPAAAPGHVPDEDALAYWRGADEYTNVVAAELDDGRDFARCVARLFVLTSWRLAIMSRLAACADDPVLRAIATKAVPELSYHREYAAGWVIRLGDGTDESHARTRAAFDWIWPHRDELFTAEPDARDEVGDVLRAVLAEATLTVPEPAPATAREHAPGLRDGAGDTGRAPDETSEGDGCGAAAGPGEPAGGRSGQHTNALTPLLADMQSVARAHPEATW